MPASSGVGGRLSRLCLKELRETLRDRRTVVTLVLMPLLVYPLLTILFHRLQSFSQHSLGQLECIVGVESEQLGQAVRNYLSLGEQLLRGRGAASAGQAPTAPGAGAGNADEPLIRWCVGNGLEDQVASQQIDVAVLLRSEARARRGPGPPGTLQLELLYRPNSALSRAGVAYLQSRLQAFNEQLLIERLARKGVRARPPTLLVSRAVQARGAAASLTTLIPLILILMTITGAVYPAIDLTAGERERGTLETLMAAPVPRLGLLTAKYVAVVAVALLTATANLLAMSITLLSTGLAALVFGDEGLTLTLVLQVFALLILFAAFFSAILLALTSFARSFKEAQAYLIPLMLLALAPGMVSLMPKLQSNGLLSVLPLVNIVLLARDLFEGQVDLSLATAAVLSTVMYAVAAIALAARIFGTDAILYGSQASWSDLLFPARRRASGPSASAAMLCLALMFPLYFLSANVVARLAGFPAAARLGLAAALTAALFALFPLLVARWQRLGIREAFRLQPAGAVSCLGAVLLGVSLWPLAHEMFLLQRAAGLTSLTDDRIQAAQQLVESWKGISPLWVLLTLAIVPAACEEFFFRGYVFSALCRAVPPAATIAASAALFGVFHVVVTSALAVERFLPSTLLGLALGWVCWRTGSVFPGMLLHACHNSFLLLIACYRDQLAARMWGAAEQQHLPGLWLLGASLAVALGLLAVLLATSPKAGREKNVALCAAERPPRTAPAPEGIPQHGRQV